MKKRVILFGVFLLFWGMAAPGSAITLLSKFKTVTVEKDWRLTGRYEHSYIVDHIHDLSDIRQFIEYIQQPENHMEITGIQSRSQTNEWVDLSLQKILSNTGTIPVGTRIRCRFKIDSQYQGFEKMVSDSYSLSQALPIEKIKYQINFPHLVSFICRIEQDGKRFEKKQVSDSFTWSADNIKSLNLMITTACSWQDISDRYEQLYRQRLGKDLVFDRLPPKIQKINMCRPEEKTRLVMEYLKETMEYKTRFIDEYALMPDTPDEILQRGWGDCKDVTLLCAAMLRPLGITASVILTGKPRNDHWANQLPDPFVFNHSLLEVENDGVPEYYDWLSTNTKVALNTQQIHLHLRVLHGND